MTDAGAAILAVPCLALDIGATKIEGALVHPDGRVLNRERLLVHELGVDLIGPTADMLKRVAGDEPVTLLGVGSAGPMTRGGEEVSPLNIVVWRNFPLRAQLRERMNIDVYIDGDARALALAEGTFGAARDDDSYLSMVVSTGIGGGLVMDGRLVDGVSGNSGHVGHTNVVPNGRKCGCGGYGCLEAEASGSAIEAVTGRPPSEADASTRGRTSELVGRAVGTLASVLDFNRCYIAGSVALGFGDEFFAIANEAARTMACMEYSADLKLLPSGLGNDGPILGAALVGWRGATR
jgi:glucokinase